MTEQKIMHTVAAITVTIMITVLGGLFTWVHKLDDRMFELSSHVVSRNDLSEQLKGVVMELRAVEARLERTLATQSELARQRHVEGGGQ